ncbi:50S ribosomal protein L7/L12 [Crassaminicella profunda]|uniref:50S ribosomal protein L7/L12 n=1 Tax=Crassaminicella profunda TaxID=1286698 RepID=UPI001CA63659|nr:50S ribosomal protein L7/L12 [Crassaminicella profunda]QZY56447.1 50S ribosomal protein L7/L12 [Crassaminicella profunda]
MNNTIIWRLIGAILLISIVSCISQIRSDIARINVNLNRIAKQVGVPDTVTDELKSLLLEGKRIKAIKKYRMSTGAGLLEAKEYVDSLSERE